VTTKTASANQTNCPQRNPVTARPGLALWIELRATRPCALTGDTAAASGQLDEVNMK